MMIFKARFFQVCFLTLILLGGAPALAADHRNLEENHPTRIEDAYPIAYRSLELQSRVGFEKNGEFGDNVGLAEAELKWGALENAHLVFGLPLQFGSEVEPDRNGDINLEALYNFNVETQSLPALSIKTEVLLPLGTDSQGVGFELMGIATKGWGQNRFHVNAGYHRNSGADAGERSDLYRVGVAFDRPLDLDHLLVMDFFVDQSELKGDDPAYSFVVGVRRQLNPWTVINLGLGHAFGSRLAPDFTATLGLQFNF